MVSVLFYWMNCLFSMIIARTGMKYQKNRFYIVVASAVPLVLISSIRYGVGTDFFSYEEIFQDFEQGDMGRYEWLYSLLNLAVITMGGGFQWILFVSAIIFVGCIFTRIMKDSPSPILSIYLLMGSMVYFTYCNGLRQMTGAAICFYALEYVYKKSFIKFLILVVLAAGFHMSCWLFLVIYVFNSKYLYKLFVIVTSVSIALFYNEILEAINSVVMDSSYGGYLSDGVGGVGLHVIITFIIFGFSVVLYNTNNDKYRFYFACQFIMTAFYLYSWDIPLIFRCGWVFWIPQLVLIPMCLHNIKNKYWRITFAYVIAALFFAYSSYSIMISGTHNVVPYRTVL